MSARYTPEERALLRQYVSDLDGDVYCIYNLPEEVIAVIFAYVSRSPHSFRHNLLNLLRSGDLDLMSLPGAGSGQPAVAETEAARDAVARARKFHERYTVGYGHASVAEHAVVRVGIENISRYASSLLETANPFLSFTEYSQRYQRPGRGAYHIPRELDGYPEERRRYVAFQERAYDTYEAILPRLHEHLLATEPSVPGESSEARSRRMEKLAFEDARYALTLATHTNLGMTGNARAIRDALVVLLSSPCAEAVALAEAVKTQVQRLVPTLLRYADPNPYKKGAAAASRSLAGALGLETGGGAFVHGQARGGADGERSGRQGPSSGPRPYRSSVRLLDWTGRMPGADLSGDGGDEERALDVFLAGAALGATPGFHGGLVRDRLARWTLEQKREWARKLLADLSPHDNPHDVTHLIRYSVEFHVSEANWHQLLRHCRRIDFLAEPPHLSGGLTIPPRVEDAGLAHFLQALGEEAAAAHENWAGRIPGITPYLVLNAHRRRVWAELDLWELYHVVNLRTSPEAQWDIRETMESLYEQAVRVHGDLVRGAMRRAGKPEEIVFGQ